MSVPLETAAPYVPFLDAVTVKELFLWVTDTATGEMVDVSPPTARLLASFKDGHMPSSISYLQHRRANLEVAATGESQTLIEWVKIKKGWRKLALSKSSVGGNLVMEVGLDITHLAPRAEWLARINLVEQRLELDNGESISFAEFVVLHLLLKGYKHQRIADTLSISTKTVEYRISRIKNAMEVDTTEEMMMKVSSSGMIYLAMIPIDLRNPAQTELELYQRRAFPNRSG